MTKLSFVAGLILALVLNSAMVYGETHKGSQANDTNKSETIHVRHPIIIVFKADSTEEQQMKIVNRLQDLQELMPGFLDFEWGVEIRTDGGTEQVKHFYNMNFENMEAFKAYTVHPIHTELVELADIIAEEILGVTYEVLDSNHSP